MNEEYNRFSLKASLVLIPLLLLLWFWGVGDKSSDCQSREEEVNDRLELLKKPGSITELQVIKSDSRYARNLLIYDRLTFVDQPTLEKFRIMVIERKKGRWNRPRREWDTLVNLKLTSGDTLQMEIAKIINGEKNETHLYFMFDDCHDDYPNYSLVLGSYLEELISRKN